MRAVCVLETLQYKEKQMQILKKARASNDAFDPSS